MKRFVTAVVATTICATPALADVVWDEAVDALKKSAQVLDY